jgi:hypothetical protein
MYMINVEVESAGSEKGYGMGMEKGELFQS